MEHQPIHAHLIGYPEDHLVDLLLQLELDLLISLWSNGLGTDTGGSVRIPASYCGIFGFRPSHGVIETTGVIPMAQSFDTVGWFARDPVLLNQVGRILLRIPRIDPVRPSHVIIAEDCFSLVSLPSNRVTGVLANSVNKLFGGGVVKNARLGDYVVNNVPSLKHFRYKDIGNQNYDTESLVSLSYSMRLLVRVEDFHCKNRMRILLLPHLYVLQATRL